MSKIKTNLDYEAYKENIIKQVKEGKNPGSLDDLLGPMVKDLIQATLTAITDKVIPVIREWQGR